MLRFWIFKKQKTQKRSILGYELIRNILYNRPQDVAQETEGN